MPIRQRQSGRASGYLPGVDRIPELMPVDEYVDGTAEATIRFEVDGGLAPDGSGGGAA
jgi:hypothetical protein